MLGGSANVAQVAGSKSRDKTHPLGSAHIQPAQQIGVVLAGILPVLPPLEAVGILIAVASSMTFTFSAAPDGTKLEIAYSLTGYLPQGTNWAAATDGMLTEQITRLKNYIETGSPVAPTGAKKPV